MPPSSLTGIKRKRELQEEEESRGEQRQSVLDISMVKLRTGPSRRVEPSLRRSVLILNTLKHIEMELKREGVHTTSTVDAMNNIPEMSKTELTLDPLPDISTFIVPHPTSVPVPIENVCSNQEEVGTYCPKDSDRGVISLMPCKSVFGSACETDALSQQLASYFQDMSTTDHIEHVADATQGGDSNNNHLALHVPYFSNSLPLLEDPFSDIDISWDTDMNLVHWSSLPSAAPTTSQAGASGSSTLVSPTRLPSMSIEDIIYSFYPNHLSGPDPAMQASAAVSPPPVLNAQCSTYCRTDSTLDDLDNLMQILVGL